MNTSRRVFILQVIAGSGMAAAAAGAQAQQKLDPKDPQAVTLGYVEDTTKADQKKFPNHTTEQKCSACQLYSGAANSKQGPCAVFGGKLVMSNGWCSSWVKKT